MFTKTSSQPPPVAPSVDPTIPAQGNGRRLRARLPELQQSMARIIEESAQTCVHTNGPRVRELERPFAEFVDALAVNSGSSALRAALETAGAAGRLRGDRPGLHLRDERVLGE